MNRLLVQQNLEKIIQHLNPYSEFVNAHMVEFITKNHFENYIPPSIRQEIEGYEDLAIEYFWNHEKENSTQFKSLQKFIETTKTFYLSNLKNGICLTTDEFLGKLEASGKQIEKGLSLKIKDFMSDKKSHEVSIASALIANLAKKDGLIIDIGDGKGYLSSRLSLEYQLNVLGIDGNPTNTKNAEKRNQKLKKLWNGLVKREAIVENLPLENLDAVKNNKSSYKTASKMIYSDSSFEPLIKENFPGQSFQELSLVGLHTCGNLSANSLKIFIENQYIKSICNIGCCYHLLIEEFSDDEFFNSEYYEKNRQDVGFPISQYLRDKVSLFYIIMDLFSIISKFQKYALGRNCRMIGAHSFDRVIQRSKDYPNISLFYRALFEVILTNHGITQNYRLGRIKFNDFHDYFRKACKKHNINMNLSDKDIENYLKINQVESKKMSFYYLIRILFAPIIETIIILDRYLYLLENNVSQSFVVKLFDPVVSPRCYGIIAYK
jgi:hypothetical protein